MSFTISSKEQLRDLWTGVYQEQGRPNWSYLLPYYHPDIEFRDSVQTIRGLAKFTAMTERLAKRSGNLEMSVSHAAQADNVIFLEWKLTLRYKKLPESAIFGTSRVVLNEEGKIIRQRDYYDLWGDILDAIPGLGRWYRRGMFRLFG